MMIIKQAAVRWHCIATLPPPSLTSQRCWPERLDGQIAGKFMRGSFSYCFSRRHPLANYAHVRLPSLALAKYADRRGKGADFSLQSLDAFRAADHRFRLSCFCVNFAHFRGQTPGARQNDAKNGTFIFIGHRFGKKGIQMRIQGDVQLRSFGVKGKRRQGGRGKKK